MKCYLLHFFDFNNLIKALVVVAVDIASLGTGSILCSCSLTIVISLPPTKEEAHVFVRVCLSVCPFVC